MQIPRFISFFSFERTKDSKRPIFLDWRSSKEFIIVTVAFGIFVDILLYSIVVPVLPFALTSRAHVEESSVQGWISIMLAVYGVGLLVASREYSFNTNFLYISYYYSKNQAFFFANLHRVSNIWLYRRLVLTTHHLLDLLRFSWILTSHGYTILQITRNIVERHL